MRGSGTVWGGQGLQGVQQGCRTFVETLVRLAIAVLGRGRRVAYVCVDGTCLGSLESRQSWRRRCCGVCTSLHQTSPWRNTTPLTLISRAGVSSVCCSIYRVWSTDWLVRSWKCRKGAGSGVRKTTQSAASCSVCIVACLRLVDALR